MTKPDPGPRIIVALDVASADQALHLADKLDPQLCRLKIGKALFTRAGPALLSQIQARGFGIFLDLKFHDIPNTVAAACRAAAELDVWMLTVHAQGGSAMLAAARAAVSSGGPLLMAVTVLTSLDHQSLAEIGITTSVPQQVLRLARLSYDQQLDGVICSAHEASLLRSALGSDFCLVTPGIRPAQWSADDQRRTLSAAQAIAAGADYLVIGRPITQAPDPGRVLHQLNQEIF